MAVELIGEGSSCLTQGTEQTTWIAAPFASFIGLLVGLILSFVGFFAAGIGHGSYVIIGLVSSPLGTFGNVLLALFGAPVLWGLFAYLAATAAQRTKRRSFLILMALHYLTLVPIWSNPDGFGDWAYVGGITRDRVMLGFALYGIAQIALWALFAYTTTRGRFASENLRDQHKMGTAQSRASLAGLSTLMLSFGTVG